MMLDVYIGYFDENFQWDKIPPRGNAPKRRSPFFPYGSKQFSDLKARIQSGEYEGKQTDWGAWVARVNKQQIVEFISDMYAEDKSLDSPTNSHLKIQYLELLLFVETLDPENKYALAAVEGY